MTDGSRSPAAIAAAVATIHTVTLRPRRATPAVDGDTGVQVAVGAHQDPTHIEIDIEVLAGEPAIARARAAATAVELVVAGHTAVTVRIVSVTT